MSVNNAIQDIREAAKKADFVTLVSSTDKHESLAIFRHNEHKPFLHVFTKRSFFGKNTINLKSEGKLMSWAEEETERAATYGKVIIERQQIVEQLKAFVKREAGKYEYPVRGEEATLSVYATIKCRREDIVFIVTFANDWMQFITPTKQHEFEINEKNAKSMELMVRAAIQERNQGLTRLDHPLYGA